MLAESAPASSMSSGVTRSTILVVDDTPENLTVLGGLLRPFYHVRVANSGPRALRAVDGQSPPDLILLDVMMPDMSGYEVMDRLRQSPATQDIPVIFVTAMNADEDEERGLKLGAVDYVTKPVRPAILLSRVRTHLELKQARVRLERQNHYLEGEVAYRMRENELIKDVSLYALALLAEARDNETGAHLHRTQAYVDRLAHHLQAQPHYAGRLSDARRVMIVKAAPLHDIGKVGIPDHILLKPGRLTPEEFAIMRTHARIGGEAIAAAMDRVAQAPLFHDNAGQGQASLEFLETARQIAHYHHEKWDGSGYPEGLAGEEIPLPARLMALADVFDALICKRVYKAAFPVEEVDRIILEGRGRHFDPDLVDAYGAVREAFLAIAARYRDESG